MGNPQRQLPTGGTKRDCQLREGPGCVPEFHVPVGLISDRRVVSKVVVDLLPVGFARSVEGHWPISPVRYSPLAPLSRTPQSITSACLTLRPVVRRS